MRMRSGDEAIRRISLITIAALVIYAVFSFIGAAVNPLRTTVLQSMTVDDISEIDGYIIREETVLSGEGYVFLAGDGDKISVGDAVAVKYEGNESAELATRINSLKTTIAQLEKEQNGRKSVYEQASDSVISLSSSVESGSISDVRSSAVGVRTYIFGRSSGEDAGKTLDELYSQLNALEVVAQSNTSYIKASVSGIFSSVTDGYECVTIGDVKNLNADTLQNAFSGKLPPVGATGKLVTGLSWYYCAIMSEENASGLKKGSAVSIDFESSFGRTVRMTVESKSQPADGRCAVFFSSNKYISDIAALRTLSGKIYTSSVSGMVVPRSGINYREDGSAYVYILAGLQARETDISIIREFDDYVLAEEVLENADDTALLRVGAELIVSAKGLYDGKVVK